MLAMQETADGRYPKPRNSDKHDSTHLVTADDVSHVQDPVGVLPLSLLAQAPSIRMPHEPPLQLRLLLSASIPTAAAHILEKAPNLYRTSIRILALSPYAFYRF